jgi:hypothetical protein
MATRQQVAAERRAQVKAAALYPLDWLEERSGLVGGIRYFLFRKTSTGSRRSALRR